MMALFGHGVLIGSSMDLSFLDGFGGDFTGNLANSIVTSGIRGLRGVVLRDAETAALARCFDQALSSALQRTELTTLTPDRGVIDQTRDYLNKVFALPSVAQAFVSAALTGNSDPIELTSRAFEEGVDPETCPFEWFEFLGHLLLALDQAVHDEAASAGSPLQGRVALSELFRIRCAITAKTKTPEEVVERLTDAVIVVDPAAHIGEFIREYLGTTGHPKPFGGRQLEIETLNDWLYDPQGRPRLLLDAPAGRGKSSLLVHWARQLPPDVGVVFVPVSLRFQTAQPMAFLPALAAGLARLHGEPLDASTFVDAALCRSLSLSLMQRPPKHRFLVVIVDGADEAGPYPWAGHFPAELPPNVRVVVSARQIAGEYRGDHWLGRLGWDVLAESVRPFELPGLDRAGVAEALRGMALPAHCREPAMVDRLYYLTAGDPLLVGLYAEQLWYQYRERPDLVWTLDDLNRLRPGLESFFERWLSDQERLWDGDRVLERDRARAVLAILAHAIGPLFADELREMMRLAYDVQDWTLRSVLTDLERFIVGDGVRQGYALSHPRLAEFFSRTEFIGGPEARRVRESYLRWGRQTLDGLNAGQLAVETVPPYLLGHLGDHFVREAAPLADLRSLLSEGWVRAWGHADPTHRGLLGDVQRAWDAARDDTLAMAGGHIAPSLGSQVRCLLYYGSVSSAHQQISPEVLLSALDEGLLSPGQILNILAYTLRRSDFTERVEGVARGLSREAGLSLAALVDLKQPWLAKVSALVSIAGELHGADRILVADKAFRAARSCEDEFDRLCSTILLLPFMPEARRLAEARGAVLGLQAFELRRVGPAVVEALSPYLPEEAQGWAKRCVERYFVLSGFEPEASIGRIFGLLADEDRVARIREALDWTPEQILQNYGRIFEVVGPYLDDEQLRALVRKIGSLEFAGQMVVLSCLDGAPIEALVPDLFDRAVREITSSGGAFGTLSFTRWRSFLNFFDEPRRTYLAETLISVMSRAVGSSQWLDLVSQLLPLLPPPLKRRVTAEAISHGRRHFDEVPAIETLGGILPFLPENKRETAEKRLADRVVDYVAQHPLHADPRRIYLALDLLPYMEPAAAAELAEALHRSKKAENHVNITILGKTAPFLTGPARDEAIALIRAWASDAKRSGMTADDLASVRQWLTPDEFDVAVSQLLAEAEAEQEDRLAARNLAQILPVLPAEGRETLIRRLLQMAQSAEDWEETWIYVLGSIGAYSDPHWALENICPLLMQSLPRQLDPALRALVRVAKAAKPPAQVEILRLLLAAAPLDAWPQECVIDVLPLVKGGPQLGLLVGMLRELSGVRRSSQFSSIEKLLPTLSVFGGPDAVEEAWEAVWEASSWWP